MFNVRIYIKYNLLKPYLIKRPFIWSSLLKFYLFGIKKSIKKRIKGKNNKIYSKYAALNKVEIKIIGNNNVVEFNKFCRINNAKLYIKGNNNGIVIGENVKINRPGCCFWVEGTNNLIKIGRETSIESAHFAATEKNTRIFVGENCLFAYDIDVRTGDSHSIIDLDNNQRINPAKDVIIGDHVWIAAHVIILKGVIIEKNSVIGTGAVVTNSISKNCIAVGNPAKVIKNHILWDSKRL